MRNNILFGVLTTLLTAVIVLLSVQTVTAQRKDAMQVNTEAYERIEDAYTKSVRDILNTWYISNAGISMTKVIHEDGFREYTVSIHHERINKLSPQKKEELKKELEKLAFPLPDCEVFHTFLSFES